MEEFAVVGVVVDGFAGIPRGPYAGLSAKGIDFEAGVVGEGGKTGGGVPLAGFFDRVGFEGEAVFDDVGKVREIEGADEVQAREREDGLDFLELVRVAGGDK